MGSLQDAIGVLGAKQARQVRVGNLWHEPSIVEKILHHYCKQIFILTGDSLFPYQFVGSGLAVRFQKKHLLFCTRHQIARFDPDNVAIYTASTNSTITASLLKKPTITADNNDTDWIDICAFEYKAEDYNVPNLSSEFFSVEDGCIWPAMERGHFMVFGYPTEHQDVDYGTPHINARVVAVSATYDGKSHSPYLHRIKMGRTEIFDADGMSGGPVFYLGGIAGSYFIGLAGLIVRGGRTSDFLHFIEARFLQQMATKEV